MTNKSFGKDTKTTVFRLVVQVLERISLDFRKRLKTSSDTQDQDSHCFSFV